MHTDLRERLHKARTLDDMAAVVDECERRRLAPQSEGHHAAANFPFCCAAGSGYTSWYRRHHWEQLRHAHKLATAAQQAEAPAAALDLEVEAAPEAAPEAGLPASEETECW